MIMIPIKWTMRTVGSLPILDLTGENLIGYKDKPFPEVAMKLDELILVNQAVMLIKKAKYFKGVPYENEPCTKNESLLSVRFSLFFPSMKEMKEFIGFVNH